MASPLVFSSSLTKADHLVLQRLDADIKNHAAGRKGTGDSDDDAVIATLEALNDPNSSHFEPTVFMGIDLDQVDARVPKIVRRLVLGPYIRAARSLVRVDTDVVMVTHLLLYLTTSLPSAVLLFWHFSWAHGLLHVVMQGSYMGAYTLLMHQHIHMRGVLVPQLAALDQLLPYVLGPLMGHTWNSYFYHHVKHHHVEGNGPDDLSSTLRYQRDSPLHFAHYVGRFLFLIWIDLPWYFIRKGRVVVGLKAGGWELATYAAIYSLWRLNAAAATCTLLLPLALMRVGMMVGNWGQHAFVDRDEPDSDYRSSITLIDVQSNRHCFNDGYHTSHHLNPRRHWREHPAAFLKGKHLYASQHALVFHNIDYILITIRLLSKQYRALAECMVPIGDQIPLSMDERAALLKRATQQFTEEELRVKFRQPSH